MSHSLIVGRLNLLDGVWDWGTGCCMPGDDLFSSSVEATFVKFSLKELAMSSPLFSSISSTINVSVPDILLLDGKISLNVFQ